MPFSAAERHRRSEQAKRMHAEGRLGNRQVHRRAVERASELRTARANERASRIAQDLLERHREKVEGALVEALERGTRAQRIKAAEVITRLALSGERTDTSVAKAQAEHHSREELLALVAQKLSTGPAAQLVQRQLEVIDGTAEEVQ